jgi:hypothetical protein
MMNRPQLPSKKSGSMTVRHMLSFALACAALLWGCAQPKPAAPGNAPAASNTPDTGIEDKPDANRDPCAQRLHDLSGPMLLYVALHDQLPPSLDALKTLPGAEPDLKTNCPVSGQAYGYNAQGIEISGIEYRIYAWDASPAHGTYRWAIQLVPSIAGRPPYANVIPIPETSFKRR